MKLLGIIFTFLIGLSNAYSATHLKVSCELNLEDETAVTTSVKSIEFNADEGDQALKFKVHGTAMTARAVFSASADMNECGYKSVSLCADSGKASLCTENSMSVSPNSSISREKTEVSCKVTGDVTFKCSSLEEK